MILKTAFVLSSLSFVFQGGTAFAQSSASPVSSPKVNSDFETGVEYLRRGTWYTLAISYLQKATKVQPDDCSTQLYLSAAYLNRAVSLLDAVRRRPEYDAQLAQYRKQLQVWQEGQVEGNPLNGSPKPVEPERLTTRDDNKPFALQDKEAKASASQLFAEAKSCWDKAKSLATEPEMKGKVFYFIAWEKQLLRRSANRALISDDLPSRKEVIADLQQAVEISPKVANYWQALGDVLSGDAWASPRYDRAKEAEEAYTKSVKFNPKSADAAYRLMLLSAELKHWDVALGVLPLASTRETDNSYYDYQKASLIYSQITNEANTSDYQQFVLTAFSSCLTDDKKRQQVETALESIRQGNAKQNYRQTRYTSPLPRELLATWNYEDQSNLHFWKLATLRHVESPTREIALAYAKRGEIDKAIETANLVVEMGSNYLGQYFRYQYPLKNTIEEAGITHSYSIARSGLETLQVIADLVGDTKQKEEIERRTDLLVETRKRLLKHSEQAKQE